MTAIDLIPFLCSYDIWGDPVGIEWKAVSQVRVTFFLKVAGDGGIVRFAPRSNTSYVISKPLSAIIESPGSISFSIPHLRVITDTEPA